MIFFILIILIFIFIMAYYYKFLKRVTGNDIISLIVAVSLLFGSIISLYLSGLFIAFLIYVTMFNIIISLIVLIIKKVKKININNKVYLLSIVFSLLFCIYGYINSTFINQTNYVFKTDKIKSDTRILFISDCHYGSVLKKDRLDKVIDEINKIKDIDLVILGGDITDERTSIEDFRYIYDKIGSIKENNGKFAIMGNHDDNIAPDAFVNNRINILTDEVMIINDNISLIGRNEYFHGRRQIDELVNDYIKNTYMIALDHQPKDYNKLSEEGIDLVLSGHTHDGQLFPLNIFIDVFNTSEMSYGYKKVKDMNAVVTSGLGGWLIPLRTTKRSEFVIIDIKNK